MNYRVYKEKLNGDNFKEVCNEFSKFSSVLNVETYFNDNGKVYLQLEFNKEILAFDKESNEFVLTESWMIFDGESFEFYPDDLKLIVE